MSYCPPVFNGSGFNCPHCKAYAQMEWNKLYRPPGPNGWESTSIFQAICQRCHFMSVWLCNFSENELAMFDGAGGWRQRVGDDDGEMIFPAAALAPMPSEDLPEDCLDDYMEARAIAASSPRAAAALLRLVVQKLCKHFGEPGRDINADIGSLVQKGLPKKLQEALDVVRVVGNEAVHPGEIDFDDNPGVAHSIFQLINLIVEKMITEPKQIAEIYQSLPAKKLAGIEQRDKPKP